MNKTYLFLILPLKILIIATIYYFVIIECQDTISDLNQNIVEKYNKILPIYGSILMLIGITISDINRIFEI